MMKIAIKCEEAMLRQFQTRWHGNMGYETTEIDPEYIDDINETICQLDWQLSEPRAENIYYCVPHLKTNTGKNVVLPVNRHMDMYSAALYYCAILHSIGLHPLLMVCEHYVLAGVWLDEQSQLDEEQPDSTAIEGLLYAEGGNLLLVDVWRLLHRQSALIMNAQEYDRVRSEKTCIVDFEKENDGEEYLIQVEHIEEYIEVQYVDVQQVPYIFHFGTLSPYDDAVAAAIGQTAPQLFIDRMPVQKQWNAAAEAALSALLQQKTVLLLTSGQGTEEILRLGREHSCGDLHALFSAERAVPPAVSPEMEVSVILRRNYGNILSSMQKLQQTDEQTGRPVYEYFEEYLMLDADTLRWKELYLPDNGEGKDTLSTWGAQLEKVTEEIVAFRDTYGEHTQIFIDMRNMNRNVYDSFSRFVHQAVNARDELKQAGQTLLTVCGLSHEAELSDVTWILEQGKEMVSMAAHPEKMSEEQRKNANGYYQCYTNYREYIKIRDTYFDAEKFESLGMQKSEDIESHLSCIARAGKGTAHAKSILHDFVEDAGLHLENKSFADVLDILSHLLNLRYSLAVYFDDMKAVSDIFGSHVSAGTILYQMPFIMQYEDLSDNMKRLISACAADGTTGSSSAAQWLTAYQQYKDALTRYKQAVCPPESIFQASENISEELLQLWQTFVESKAADTYFENLNYLSRRFFHTDRLIEEEHLPEKMRQLITVHNARIWSDRLDMRIEKYADRRKRFDNLHLAIGREYVKLLSDQQARIWLLSFEQAAACLQPSDERNGLFDLVIVCTAEQGNREFFDTLPFLCGENGACVYMTEDGSRSEQPAMTAFLRRIPMALVYDNANETGDSHGTDA